MSMTIRMTLREYALTKKRIEKNCVRISEEVRRSEKQVEIQTWYYDPRVKSDFRIRAVVMDDGVNLSGDSELALREILEAIPW